MTTATRKPSEILREMPRDKWTRCEYTDGQGRYCAFGWLGHTLGLPVPECGDFDDFDADGPFIDAILETFAIPSDMASISALNDFYGLDSVIAALERVGR